MLWRTSQPHRHPTPYYTARAHCWSRHQMLWRTSQSHRHPTLYYTARAHCWSRHQMLWRTSLCHLSHRQTQCAARAHLHAASPYDQPRRHQAAGSRQLHAQLQQPRRTGHICSCGRRHSLCCRSGLPGCSCPQARRQCGQQQRAQTRSRGHCPPHHPQPQRRQPQRRQPQRSLESPQPALPSEVAVAGAQQGRRSRSPWPWVQT